MKSIQAMPEDLPGVCNLCEGHSDCGCYFVHADLSVRFAGAGVLF